MDRELYLYEMYFIILELAITFIRIFYYNHHIADGAYLDWLDAEGNSPYTADFPQIEFWFCVSVSCWAAKSTSPATTLLETNQRCCKCNVLGTCVCVGWPRSLLGILRACSTCTVIFLMGASYRRAISKCPHLLISCTSGSDPTHDITSFASLSVFITTIH